MSETIPEDIRAKALRVANDWVAEYRLEELDEYIARALLAERLAATERAAKIAEASVRPSASESFIKCAEHIAAAIRSQP